MTRPTDRGLAVGLTLGGVLGLLAASLLVLPLALAPRAEAYIYWSSGAYGIDIGRANLDGTGLNESFITRGGHNAAPVRVDAGHIYWSEYWGDPAGTLASALGRARLDGTHVDEKFIAPSTGLGALDANYIYSPQNRLSVGGTFFSASIGRRNLDGRGVLEEFITGLEGPVAGIAVDRNHIYWAQDRGVPITPGEIAAIGRANLDGTGVEREFITFPYPAGSPTALALDASHVYWATRFGQDFSQPTIGRANLDGTGVDRSFITGETHTFDPTDLAVDADHIYWANPGYQIDPKLSGSIGRANLDGASVDERFIVPPGHASPFSVAVDARTDTTIRAKASAKRTQKQTGKRIHVAVKVKAKERLTAKASGKVTVNPSYKLKPKKVQVAAGKTKTLRLKPKKATAEKIAAALKRGEKVKAKLSVKLTDLAGNTESEKLRVRLRR